MKLTIIAAVAKNRVIGVDGDLPWRLSADLKRFKALTMGKPILMGRKTYDSIGRPLPGRQNIVITRNPNLEIEGCTVVTSLEAALAACGEVEEAMIIGGASLYAEALPRADGMQMTVIDAEIPGDTFFPEYDPAQWKETGRETVTDDDQVPWGYAFVELTRI